MILIYLSLLVLLGQVYSQDKLSEEDKQSILEHHNDLRRTVSPTAANMLEMVWDDSLAEIAQTYADKCVFKHNPDRASQSTFRSVGENIAATTSRTLNYKSLVSLWFKEKANYNYERNSCSKRCGHYTQVVWAKSYSLGCGVKHCPKLENVGGSNWAILICNYGPAGNFRGVRPYKGGAPCSQCPADREMCADSLCTTGRIPAFGELMESYNYQEEIKIL